jgi:hypothetical protein
MVKRATDDERFAVSGDVAHREVNGRLLLLLPDSNHLYAFNDSGRVVWQGLLRQRSATSIAATIARKFGVSAARAERDVRDLLNDLVRRGVIRRVG